MRKAFVTVALLSAILICNGQNSIQGFNDMANLNRYAKENVELPKVLSNGKQVVFIGNSITERWVKVRPDFFKSNNYIGRGISGQTSPQLLLRFRQDVINLKPTAVVINVGTNDIAENTGVYDADFTFGNIKSMAELARANGVKVILSSLTPAAKYYWRVNVENVVEKISALNNNIKQYAQENNFAYIDYFSALADAEGALPFDFGRDGVHPNAEAYEIMERKALEVISTVVK